MLKAIQSGEFEAIASPPPETLGKIIADQSDGTEVDRAGRVVVEPDLTVKGHPNVFVVGDLMSVPDVPGMAQGAIQGAHYATTLIKHMVKGTDDPATRKPFSYFDKGSMATISRFSAVAQVGKLEFGGFIAWLAWLGVHILFLVGFTNKLTVVIRWVWAFFTRRQGARVITANDGRGNSAMTTAPSTSMVTPPKTV